MRAVGGAGVRSRREAPAPRLGCLALSKAMPYDVAAAADEELEKNNKIAN